MCVHVMVLPVIVGMVHMLPSLALVLATGQVLHSMVIAGSTASVPASEL